MPVDTDLFEEFMKAAKAAGKPEEPKKTIGEKYREEQLEKRGPPRLKDWYRKALRERAELDKGEPGAYQPVLNALALANMKQGNDVYALTTPNVTKPTDSKLRPSAQNYSDTTIWNVEHKWRLNELEGQITSTPMDVLESDIGLDIFKTKVEQRPTWPPGKSSEWDYRNPWEDPILKNKITGEPITYNQDMESLPEFALGWTAGGRPWYGKSVWAPFRKVMSNNFSARNVGYGWEEDEDATWWQKIRAGTKGKNSLGSLITRDFLALIVPFISAPAEGIRAVLGTESLLAETLAEKSGLPELGNIEVEMLYIALGGVGEESEPPEWLVDWVERVSPIRNSWNRIRALDTIVRGRVSFDDIATVVKESHMMSRMAYSIGAGERGTKDKFLYRVNILGEDPAIVAEDMAQPLSEMAGLIFGDPLNVFDFLAGTATRASKMDDVYRLSGVSDEMAEVLAKYGDELQNVPAGNLNEVLEGIRATLNRTISGVEGRAGSFGLFTKGKRTGSFKWIFPKVENSVQFARTGFGKRHIANKGLELFGKTIGSWTKNPDDIADLVVNIAKLVSEDIDEASASLNYVMDAVESPELLFSDNASEWIYYTSKLLDDGTGKIDPRVIARNIQKIVDDGGGVSDVINLVNKKLNGIATETYPTMSELIKGEKLLGAGEEVANKVRIFFENGGQINALDRLIDLAETKPGLLGKQRNLAGTLYIGMNPQVATRGIMYDTLNSTIDAGLGIHLFSPSGWSERLTKILGYDHPGLMQGVAKADIPSITKLIDEAADWRTMDNLAESFFNVKGWKKVRAGELGAGEVFMEMAKNAGGRLLQSFEVLTSQKTLGYHGWDGFKYLVRKVLPGVDELIQLGMPVDLANSLKHRIISTYGDTPRVVADVLEEINKTGGVSKIAGMDWIDEPVIKVIEEFHVFDEIMNVLSKPAATMDELLDGVRLAWARLQRIQKRAAKQHVIPMAGADAKTSVQTILEGVFPAQAAEHVDDAFVFELSNVVEGGTNTINAISRATRELETTLVNALDPQIVNYVEQRTLLREAFRQVDYITRNWDSATGISQASGNKAWEFTRRLADDAESVPQLVDEIKSFLKIDIDISKRMKRPVLRDLMWTTWKQIQRDMFRTNRLETVEGFFDFLDNNLYKQFPEFAEQIKNSDLVQTVINNNLAAKALDQAIMMGDEMKPLGYIITAAEDLGQTDNAVRAIATYLHPWVAYGEKGADTTILQTVNKYSDEVFETFADIATEDALKALQKFRQDRGLPQLLESLDELVGYSIEKQIRVWTEHGPITVSSVDEIPDIIEGMVTTGKLPPVKSSVVEGNIEDFANMKPKDLIEYVHFPADDPLDQAKLQRLIKELTGGWNPKKTLYVDVVVDANGVPKITDGRHRLLAANALGFDNVPIRVTYLEGSGKTHRMSYLNETIEGIVSGAPSVTPPPSGNPSFSQHVFNSQYRIGLAFQNLLDGIKANYGKVDYVNVTDELLEGLTKWGDDTARRMEHIRYATAQYAQAWRDFGLHDYGDRFAIDALLSAGYNFHFWPTRTLAKLPARLSSNLGLAHKYAEYREAMEKLHADSPPWYRQVLNTNELLGLHSDNPLLINLENTFIPYANMMGGFDDPDRRVNWWSSVVDDMGNMGVGHPSMLIQYAVAAGLKAINEDEAASLFAGRLIPITRQIQGLTSLMGINEGRGVELDPAIRFFSEEEFFSEKVMGPYERKKVATVLAHYVANNPDLNISEAALDNAWKNGGPLWDLGVALVRQQNAPGNLLSTFVGIGVKNRSLDDLTTTQFWADYIQLLSRSDSMDAQQFKQERRALFEEYPFATYMILGRKGGKERDAAYIYSVFSRASPGQLDNLAEIADLDYELITKFYDAKGNPEEMNPKDWDELVTFAAQAGATLALPDKFTKGEWDSARDKYQAVLVEGQEQFAPYIWELVDMGYVIKGNSMNQQRAWYDFLEQHPIVEEAMQWREAQIFSDPVLAAYYGPINTLRSFYLGQMYQTLEDEFGSGIWDKVIVYDAFRDSGQSDAAKAYKKANPDLKAYYDTRDELSKVVTAAMVEYGEKLPEGKDMRLRKDIEEPSVIEQKIMDFVEGPKPKTYNRQEWIGLIGKEAYSLARLAWEEISIPEDIENELRNIARDFNMTYEEFLLSIGATD